MAKQQSKAKLTNNKENLNSNKNTSNTTQIKTGALGSKIEVVDQSQQKDYLVSTTSESRTEKSQTTADLNKLVNNRYNDSNFKSQTDQLSTIGEDDSIKINYSQQHHQQEIPFYMQRNMPSQMHSTITDEDVESFQKKLDTLIINFRSETMSEFMKTKKQVIQDQNSAIDAERRRCNTLLGVKQNEIEQLKESLGNKTKMCEELAARCEGMAFWAGKSKLLLRIKLLQNKSFEALKQYWMFKKHSKKVLEHKLKAYKKKLSRKAFQGWQKQYKEWKVIKNRDDFEKAVKQELQTICAQYNKEIESLRDKLSEATQIVEGEQRNKAMVQENLKKAFMRGVCALNFEAMSILNPNDLGYQAQVEREMEKQVINAMQGLTMQTSQQQMQQPMSSQGFNQFESFSQAQRTPLSEVSQSKLPAFMNYNYETQSQAESSYGEAEKKFMQIDNTFDNDYKKVESKDSMWKPAPIMGREVNQQSSTNFTFSQPSITSALRTTQQQQSYVLPSHFNKMQEPQLTMKQDQVTFNTLNQDTSNRTAMDPSPVVNVNDAFNYNSTGLPQITQNQQFEGKTIVAKEAQNNTAQHQKSTGNKANQSKQLDKKATSTITSSKKKL